MVTYVLLSRAKFKRRSHPHLSCVWRWKLVADTIKEQWILWNLCVRYDILTTESNFYCNFIILCIFAFLLLFVSIIFCLPLFSPTKQTENLNDYRSEYYLKRIQGTWDLKVSFLDTSFILANFQNRNHKKSIWSFLSKLIFTSLLIVRS